MSVDKTFCILPWLHLACNAGGTLRLCCNSTPGKNVSYNQQGKPLSINIPGEIEEFWNSDLMVGVRADMLAGKEPSVCTRCFTEERTGVRSARQSYNDSYQKYKADLVLDPSGRADLSMIKYVDLRLGNLCNLKCRMCNPYASTQWIDEWNEVFSEDVLTPMQLDRLRSLNWYDDENFISNIVPYLSTVDQIYLTGGEPTLAVSQYKLLDICIERGLAPNITLKYNTNITNMPRKMLDYWIKFKGINLNLSLDAVGDLDRYIRYPSNWTQIDKNVRTLDAMAVDRPTWNLSVHATVQVYNITRLRPLFDYVQDLQRVNPFPYLNILNHPEFFNIRILPSDLKRRITDELLEWRQIQIDQASKASTSVHFSKLVPMLDYMNSIDRSDLLQRFFAKSDQMDALRNQRLADVLPEIDSYR